MTRTKPWLVLLAAAALAGPPAASAGIVVNEVLANEPGGLTSLEWIELYNHEDSATVLDNLTLDISGQYTVSLAGNAPLDLGAYLVICRRLFTEGSSIGFEQVWGNNSGAWGDCETETAFRRPIEATFSLGNAGGYASLLDHDAEVSRLNWIESGRDGCSWERVAPDNDSIAQCRDPQGGTPGALNSTAPVAHDLSLALSAVRAINGAVEIELEIGNLGTAQIDQSYLLTFVCDDSMGTPIELIDSIQIGPLESGASGQIILTHTFAATCTPLLITVPRDDRPANNSVRLVAPGYDYPPLLLSEILANPADGLESEWIELYNRDDIALDLNGWQIGDAHTMTLISTDSGTAVAPHSFVILAQDSSAFRSYYRACTAPVLQPSPWPTLNNTGDSVRLVGPVAIEADRFAFSETFDHNRTWCRDLPDSRWSCSRDDNGTPGTFNSLAPSENSALTLVCSPRIFAPGREETIDINFVSTETPVTIRLFDRAGRIVRTFDDMRNEVVWNGRSDSGRPLPIGIYIVVAEDDAGRTAKETVVIAR